MALFTIYVYLQVVNYNHMMPTRYSVDISFDKTNINKELMKVRTVTRQTIASVQQSCKCEDAGGGHSVAAVSVQDTLVMQDRDHRLRHHLLLSSDFHVGVIDHAGVDGLQCLVCNFESEDCQ